jgi:hypothetical protein
LDKVKVQVTPLKHNFVIDLEVVPNTGAIITAIPSQKAQSLMLSHVEIVFTKCRRKTTEDPRFFAMLISL